MKISELPPDLRELAERRRLEQRGRDCDTDKLSSAFVWQLTPEGEEFWQRVNMGENPLVEIDAREEAEKWARAKLNEWYGISDGAKLTTAGVADYNQTIDAMLAMYDKFVLNKD